MKTTMPLLARAEAEAAFQPRTYDEEARTVELVWTTGARVRRADWLDGEYDEELVVTEDAIDMGRLTSGRAPLLGSHNSSDLSDVLGVVESAWILGPNGRKEGRCKVRFSNRAEVEPILQDVRDGILRNISVGYRVHRWEKRQEKGDTVPVMRAVRWEPMEISLVAMGADAAAQVRSDDGRGMFETEIVIVDEDSDMTKRAASGQAAEAADVKDPSDVAPQSHEHPAPPAPKGSPEPESPHLDPKTGPVIDAEEDEAEEESEKKRSADPAEIARAAIREERERCAGINLTVRKLGLDPKHGEKLIADGVSLDVARKRLIDINHEQHKGSAVSSASIVRDDGETRAQAMAEALLYRAGRHAQPTELARAGGYHNMDFVDIAREVLEANGVRTRGLGKVDVAKMALDPSSGRAMTGGVPLFKRIGGLHSTSDFSNILSSTINTSMRDAYTLATPTFAAWARRTTVPDFRAINRVQISEVSRLGRVNEHGEYKRGTLTDSKESYQVVKYGEVIGITYETIVNDYMDVFGRIPTLLANAARSLESDIVYSILLANAAMADGTALIHSNHGNVGTAATIGTTSIGEGMSLMAVQTASNGSPMNLMPSFLLVPPGIRPAAEQLVNGTIVPEQQSNVVPSYMRALTVITEARLATGVTVDGTTYSGDTNGWWLLASPNAIDTVEYAYLQGEDGVVTETRNGFDVDGVETKVRLVFGAKALDWRGIVRNVGA